MLTTTVKKLSAAVFVLLSSFFITASVYASPSLSQQNTATAVNKPQAVTIPKHKNIITAKPASRQIMREPQIYDFYQSVNTAGGYALFIPKAFGSNTLADYPQVNGPMQVFAKDASTLMAVNVIDSMDTLHFQSAKPLPDFADKTVLCKWRHPTPAALYCTLSRHTDYNGDKLILQAKSTQQRKTYELLYLCPFNEYITLLPQILYSLNSFKYTM